MKDKLFREDYFTCPIYWMDKPEWVKKLNKASDPYIKAAAKSNKKIINEMSEMEKEYKDEVTSLVNGKSND